MADSPTGKFKDYGPVVEFGKEAIDAFILEDKGKLYISWKAYGLDNQPIELLACKLTDDALGTMSGGWKIVKTMKVSIGSRKRDITISSTP